MKRFHPGQQIVCTNKSGWRYQIPIVKIYLFGLIKKTYWKATGPSYNDVVTVSSYQNTGPFMFLKEYPGINPETNNLMAYPEYAFEPLVSDNELSEALEGIKEPFQL